MVYKKVHACKEWVSQARHIVLVRAFKAIKEDLAIAVILDISLTLIIDVIVRNDKLLIRDGNVQGWEDREGKIAIISAISININQKYRIFPRIDLRAVRGHQHIPPVDRSGGTTNLLYTSHGNKVVPYIF